MASNLNPQQFGLFIPKLSASTHADILGGNQSSTVPEQRGKKIPDNMHPVSREKWLKVADRFGYGNPN